MAKTRTNKARTRSTRPVETSASLPPHIGVMPPAGNDSRSSRRITMFEEAFAFLCSIGEPVSDGDALFEPDHDSGGGRFTYAGEEISINLDRDFEETQRLVHFLTGLVYEGKVLCAQRMVEEEYLDADFAGLATVLAHVPGHDVAYRPNEPRKVTGIDPRLDRTISAATVVRAKPAIR